MFIQQFLILWTWFLFFFIDLFLQFTVTSPFFPHSYFFILKESQRKKKISVFAFQKFNPEIKWRWFSVLHTTIADVVNVIRYLVVEVTQAGWLVGEVANNCSGRWAKWSTPVCTMQIFLLVIPAAQFPVMPVSVKLNCFFTCWTSEHVNMLCHYILVLTGMGTGLKLQAHPGQNTDDIQRCLLFTLHCVHSVLYLNLAIAHDVS
jgi:hypothetical protein